MPSPVSIVINTYNRASTIGHTLESLKYLDYPDFEVIVVNGPSTDNTMEVLQSYEGAIKIGHCQQANLSVSRNIGIALAEGEVVAFIDDDAVPEPEWLSRIVAGYTNDDVGGVGGFVYDHTGYAFQSRYILCDRVGNAQFECEVNPTKHYNFPFTRNYCSPIGTNATFRRSALLKIGGFDEYFAYFLDETDVCLRLVDLGYQIVFVDDAFVHHKFAPSHLRDTRRVLKDRTQIARSKGYFMWRNSKDVITRYEAFEGLQKWLEMVKNGICWEADHGLISENEKWAFLQQLHTGIEEGISAAAATETRAGLAARTLDELKTPFVRFPTRKTGRGKRVICLLSQDYPPRPYGGIGKWTSELAAGLAEEGTDVHVITRAEGHSTVDFEAGVWVHRIVPQHQAQYVVPSPFELPVVVADHSFSMHEEVRRIGSHHHVDLVVAPIWDHEGLACLLDPELTTIITLQTTLKLALETHPEWVADENHKRSYIDRLISSERLVLERAPFIWSISRAIIESIEQSYHVELSGSRAKIIPLGLEDLGGAVKAEPHPTLDVLFVGRLEARKGIDVLLRCVPKLCAEFPAVRFIIAGNDALLNERAASFKEEFLSTDQALVDAGRVVFTGQVSAAKLTEYYAQCDIFAAPSRFESFGLVFLEAMMFGKPVIGCRAGGMVEIIAQGENGYLVEPGNWLSLYEGIADLLRNEALRRQFGKKSREIFERSFTRDTMVNRANAYFEEIIKQAQRTGQGRERIVSLCSCPAAKTGGEHRNAALEGTSNE
jgi:glycogen synthase